MSTASAPRRPSTVVLVGNPRPGSRTGALASLLAELLPPDLVAGRPTVLELGELVAVSFGAEPAVPTAPHPDPWAVVRGADLLLVATPTYKGTYSGLLKLFLDQFRAGDLSGTTAVPVAVAGHVAHRRSVVETLTTLLQELGARVPAPGIGLLEKDIPSAAHLVSRWVEEHAATLRDSVADATAATDEARETVAATTGGVR